jgi:cobyrinic acid a,c-diamide synthase
VSGTTRALVIAAPASGSGKTVIALALMRALAARGAAVAAAKSGPDYIDPRFHEAATGQISVTLDAWAMDAAELRARALVTGGDPLIVEGAMGALDGAPPDGRGSVADLAEALGAPVALVIDASRAAQSVALPLAGLAALRPGLRVAGAILNRVGSERHASAARRAVEAAGFAALGAVPRDPGLALPSRHLGLVQAAEHPDLAAFVARAAEIVARSVDLDAIAAAAAPVAGPVTETGRTRPLPPLGGRIAVAQDAAFAFAYPHMLEDWRAAGARVAPFSPLADEGPDPDADAVFLPGGYPELHAGRLAAARTFRAGMRAAAGRGALIYGECGGYMALGEGLVEADGTRRAMLGLLPLETSFAETRRSLGYRRLAPAAGAPWSGPLAGHEHHRATILREGAAARLFYAADAAGAPLGSMGLRVGRVCGSFAHVIAPMP